MQKTTITKDKVSVRQLVMVYLIIGFSPAIRFLPAYAASMGKAAGWLSPIAAGIPIGLLIFFMYNIFRKTKDKSTFEIITQILGKYFGNLVILVHLIWVLFLLGFYARYNGERLASTTFPNVNMTIFIALTLIIISFILRSGATALARMGEFLTPILILLFIFIAVFLLPKVRTDALLPVYYNDIIPIIKASAATLSLFSYALIIFMFSDIIIGKEKSIKPMIQGGLVYLFMLIILLIITIGLLGSTLTTKAANPFLIVVKQISILDTIENMESIVIAMWLFSDAMIIATMAIVGLNIMKYFFKLSDPRNLINILFIFTYIFSLGIASNRMELDLFASSVLIYINPILGFSTPALLYVVGKIRKVI